MRRAGSLMLIGAAASLVLGGCFLLPSGTPVTPTIPDDSPAPTGAPAGWAELPHCEGAPEEPWVFVDDFPSAAFDDTAADAECGDVWPQDDGETFVGVVDSAMTVDDLDEFGAALEAAGYEKLFDDFVPGTPSGEDYYGARDYYLDGVFDTEDFTRLAIEIYPSQSVTDQWTAYIDYLSPSTRLLG